MVKKAAPPIDFATATLQQLLQIVENEVIDFDDFDAIPAETHQAVLDMIVSLNCAVDNSKRGWDVQK